jgi:hypothetical protein
VAQQPVRGTQLRIIGVAHFWGAKRSDTNNRLSPASRRQWPPRSERLLPQLRRSRVGGNPGAHGTDPARRRRIAGTVGADRPAKHWITGLERVEDRALGRRTFNAEFHLSVDSRQSPQMFWEDHSDHGRAPRSKSRTIKSRMRIKIRTQFAALPCALHPNHLPLRSRFMAVSAPRQTGRPEGRGRWEPRCRRRRPRRRLARL